MVNWVELAELIAKLGGALAHRRKPHAGARVGGHAHAVVGHLDA